MAARRHGAEDDEQRGGEPRQPEARPRGPQLTLPRLGPRGEGWVVAQFALFALVAAAAVFGPTWTTVWALPFGVAGVALFAWSAWALGPALTPFPRPRPGTRRVVHGPYRFMRHPMYVSVLLLAVAASLHAPLAFVPTALLAVVLALKARVETEWRRD